MIRFGEHPVQQAKFDHIEQQTAFQLLKDSVFIPNNLLIYIKIIQNIPSNYSNCYCIYFLFIRLIGTNKNYVQQFFHLCL